MTELRSTHSLRRRLTVLMAGGFLIVLSIISAGLWKYAHDAANQTFDLLLQGASIAISERITPSPEGVMVDLPPSALEILGLSRNDRVFYRIFHVGGATITGSPDLPLPDGMKIIQTPQFFDADYRDETVRFSVLARPLVGLSRAPSIGIQIGQTRRSRKALQFDIFWKGMIGLCALAAISLFFVRVAITRAMRPLLGIESDIRMRQPSDLSPLKAEPPREVESLINAINGFMTRLHASKDNAESFIADVAHQMRTSLASVEGQLQIASRQNDMDEFRHRVGTAHEEARKTINLTSQLLSHAMVIHRQDNQVRDQVDLFQLIRSAVENILQSSNSENVEFEVRTDGEAGAGFVIAGDAVALREATVNLLQNSIQHSGGRCRIMISLRRDTLDERAAVELVVADDGPGLPSEELDRVLDRFYKQGQYAGSGIGLAIVRSVVESHSGRINLQPSDSGGLSVSLLLPIIRETPRDR
jgi:two-component system sensor histidine kinase TctE